MIKDFIKKHPRLWEIFKFLLVGGTATVIDFVVMSLVLYLFAPESYDGVISVFYHPDYAPSAVATVVATGSGFAVGLVFNYVFSLIFVFSGSDTSKAGTGGGFAIFAALSSVGLAIHLLGMYLLSGVAGINEWIVKIFLTVAVLVFNYLTRKYLLFKDDLE